QSHHSKTRTESSMPQRFFFILLLCIVRRRGLLSYRQSMLVATKGPGSLGQLESIRRLQRVQHRQTGTSRSFPRPMRSGVGQPPGQPLTTDPLSSCSVIFRAFYAFPTDYQKIFSSRERFAFLFSPVQVSGDDCRPRSRGRGGAVQLLTSTSKGRI